MQIQIPTPPWTGIGKKIESAFRKALYDFKMLDNVENLAVALSGGKDSLTTLFMLNAINGRGFPKFKLHAIHVSGEFSCGSSVNIEYLQSICDSLSINFVVCNSTQTLENLECYSCSRERRSLIFNAAKKLNAYTIAFGHTQDDHTETILMNLLNKGEFAGNAPKIHMYKYGVNIIRPLIYTVETDIIEFAIKERFIRALCRCPVGQTSMRKKVSDLLQEIELQYPNAKLNIARAGLKYGSSKSHLIEKQ